MRLLRLTSALVAITLLAACGGARPSRPSHSSQPAAIPSPVAELARAPAVDQPVAPTPAPGRGDVPAAGVPGRSDAPRVRASVSRPLIWADGSGPVAVRVSGVARASDAPLADVRVTVRDAYGLVQPRRDGWGWLELDPWANPTDADGRVYSITVTGRDALGRVAADTVRVVALPAAAPAAPASATGMAARPLGIPNPPSVEARRASPPVARAPARPAATRSIVNVPASGPVRVVGPSNGIGDPTRPITAPSPRAAPATPTVPPRPAPPPLAALPVANPPPAAAPPPPGGPDEMAANAVSDVARELAITSFVTALTRPAAPFVHHPNSRYFAETGHNVSYAFLEFWSTRHGDGTLGLPLTEEFYEGGRTVQYFEYGRLEYWPENPAPYHVLLSLLGSGIATDPIPPAAGPPTGARWFAETRHSVGGVFLPYFEGLGGVDIFDYPLSEPYEVDGVWWQWFQRQLVGYDPKRPAGDQVWRAKLGEDALSWRRIVEFKDRSAGRVNWATALEPRYRPGAEAGRVVGVVGGYWLPSGRAGYPAIDQLTLSRLDRLPEKLVPAYAPIDQWTLLWRGAPILGDATVKPGAWCWNGGRYVSGGC